LREILRESNIHFIIIIYLPSTHTTQPQRARRTNSIWQVRQGWSAAL